MNPYSIQFMAEQKIAELHREAAQERLAQVARRGNRNAHVSRFTLVRQAFARMVSARPAATAGGVRSGTAERQLLGRRAV